MKIKKTSILERQLKQIREATGVALVDVGSLGPELILSRGDPMPLEKVIGGVALPLCVVGPLALNGKFARGEFHIPLAMTERSLAAGANRGCKVLRKSGGCAAQIIHNGITRAPMFECQNISHLEDVKAWIRNNYYVLREEAAQGFSHLSLTNISPHQVGRILYLRMEFDTGDAMGMNMATLASDRLSRTIQEETQAKYISVSGNVCTDKKPSMINFIQGRGKSVVAEALIPSDVCNEILNVPPLSIATINQRKNHVGSMAAGSFGFNAQFANILSAIFIATGQDVAHVVEGSMGITLAEVEEDALRISVTIPSLIVGTVGGGTDYPCQWECLNLLGVAGSGNPIGQNANALAEIISGAVLAAEISLLAALSTGELASVHTKFRGF